ncbi:MAG: tRNA preQ1(34) S-adenosylmethionine ribosyltransferase-isomerase QueA [Planctomycetota bacterium]|jgi:S-adenosylmethionine:tRNA ribosyltransferase-isomerase
MRTSDFDYRLPPERIAQRPLAERDGSRLLVLDRSTGEVSHRVFRELPELLEPGDLVVLNDTRVVPARLYGLREKTGGRVEALFLEEIDKDSGGGRWRALTKSGGKLKVGEWLKLADGRVRARMVERHVYGEAEEGDVLEIDSREPLAAILDEVGHMPVPPYIRRDPSSEPSRLDRERYQTTYANVTGAVAAPTAGLHFTDRVFDGLDSRGIERAFVTLHVGPGTFRPVKTDDIEAHAMGPERYTVPPEAARAIKGCRARSGRVVAVGTTSVRTLESAALDGRLVEEGPGTARLFISPGHDFRVVDALVTNFHLPKGTPLVLTCAFAGREAVLSAYDEALGEGYRFLSYGDAMLIL